jgi:hypothetical protein
MLADDYRQDLSDRLAEIDCKIQVPRSLQRLLASRGPISAKPDERRRFVRFSRPAKTLLEIATTIERIPREPQFFSILTIDLGRSGAAFLHVQELYPGEIPILWLPTGKLDCRVTRCRRHHLRCYEIGTVFEAGPQSAAWLREVSGEFETRSSPRSPITRAT